MGEEEDERGDAGERAPLTLCILLILGSSVESAEPARSSCISWLLSRAAVHTEDGPDFRLFFLLLPPFKFLFSILLIFARIETRAALDFSPSSSSSGLCCSFVNSSACRDFSFFFFFCS